MFNPPDITPNDVRFQYKRILEEESVMPYIRVSDTNPAEETCKNCVYFRLHYIRNSRGKYREMAYGHCMEPRLKIRFANNKACQHWQGRGESQ